ncbi:MAG: ribonuclease HII [Candidatus Wallbacteria bacterium HGW-Wallbacteria-1]|jgi:ribonuclease HII|uniref:Ribonuclease HII n=1 Tax=Candidatus Wallbacteria bacterium HGW-Wallbacteria-1 TaxID=2013854 RepID=A0A2N1PU61_9BACT|nr:MAG: ribonuclease HII [Candidatus Wallbacteria bacterium HGW-Wallbacteria-1]
MDQNQWSLDRIRKLLKDRRGLELTATEFEMVFGDSRKGVQKLFATWRKSLDVAQQLAERFTQMIRHEREAAEKGFRVIAGIDEAGRGPLAGPVVAAAVVLNLDDPILGLDDSKKLSAGKRDELYAEIVSRSLGWSVGTVDSETIDRINILNATKKAMAEAIEGLPDLADFLLIDHVSLKKIDISQLSITRGESHSASIAAASIVAKVTRDRIMEEYSRDYPQYGFSRNKGYGSREHIENLRIHGPCPIHRSSFIGGILGDDGIIAASSPGEGI